MSDLAGALKAAGEAVEAELDRLLAHEEAPEERLIDAMRYAVLGGGKRIRPFLTIETAKLFGVAEQARVRAGAAVELVHCYSLVHDDLPAMDDDDLRRGRPTVHKAYDEATAILTGDALLTLAFEVASHPATHANPMVRLDLTRLLAKAAGAHGMVGGQMIDLAAETAAARGETLDIGGVTRLQRLKTGALIDCACQTGAVLGRAQETARNALRGYTHDLGLAFQIADDLLDVEGDEARVGKKLFKDEAAGKATFVSILGAERARDQANRLADQAIAHLGMFEGDADTLRALARFVVEREH
ncbi:MAG: polyprenyl synthetase family protein [Alphaproteobacteria bacterium]|nr:polyprenyl synthetase family protein [Alphaproteobacteria bacterium]